MNGQAADQVKGPAIGLLATAVIGSIGQIVSLLLRVLGTGFATMGGGDDSIQQMFSGGIGIVISIMGLLMAGLIVFAALQMMKLTNYGLSMAGAVIAMIPCLSPCCVLGLPIGIWALVVLMKPEVKAAFTS